MKVAELSIVIIEHLEYGEVDLKELKLTEYFLIRVENWKIIIDLYQDQNYLKQVNVKGVGNERYETQDEVEVQIELKNGDESVYQYKSPKSEVLNSENISHNILRVLKSMKVKEEIMCVIQNDEFQKNERQDLLETFLSKLKNNKISDKWFLEIKILQLFRIDDIFGDGLILKKRLQRPTSTGKPEKISFIEFDFWIYSDDQLVYHNQPEEQKKPEVGYRIKRFIDDSDNSKLIKKCLLYSKQHEKAEYTCTDTTDLLKHGFDYEIIMEKLKLIPKVIVYVFKIYQFTEGKNNFTMTVDEKLFQAERKKKDALKLIKALNFRKALKVFQAINAYFDYGNFTAEEKEKIKEAKISSLLNTTLCLLKTEDWKTLNLVCDKILDTKNPKVYLRKATALKNLCLFEEGLKLIQEYQSNVPEESWKDYQQEFTKIQIDIKQKLQKYNNETKAIYTKMFV